MTRRVIRDEVDARECLAEVAKSGRSLTSWARAHNVDGRSLTAWSRNLTVRTPVAAAVEPAGAVRLVEVVAEAPKAQAKYVVRMGGLSLEVDDQFDDGTLRRLLEVLSSCSV